MLSGVIAGSSALAGNTKYSLRLEETISRFLQLEHTVLYPTGWADVHPEFYHLKDTYVRDHNPNPNNRNPKLDTNLMVKPDQDDNCLGVGQNQSKSYLISKQPNLARVYHDYMKARIVVFPSNNSMGNLHLP